MRRWNHAKTASVVIKVALVRDRYAFGEIAVTPVYNYRGGGTREGQSHRVMLRSGREQPMSRLWDVLFEEVLYVEQLQPRSLALWVDASEMDGWFDKVDTVVHLVAHELKVPVKVCAPSSIL